VDFAEGVGRSSLAKFKGVSHGEPERSRSIWNGKMTRRQNPDGKVQGCYITTIEVTPTIVNRHMIFPATGMPHGAWTPEYFASVGMTITGMASAERHPIGL